MIATKIFVGEYLAQLLLNLWDGLILVAVALVRYLFSAETEGKNSINARGWVKNWP